MRRLRPRAAQSTRMERAIGKAPAQAKAQSTATRAGVQQSVPPPQEPASVERPEGPMLVGLAIPLQTIRPRTIPPRVIPARMIPARMIPARVIPARVMTRSARTMPTALAAVGSAWPPALTAQMLEQPCPAEELQPLTDRPSIRREDRAAPLGMVRQRVWLSVLQLASGLMR